MLLSVVIPAYNEETAIEATLGRVCAALDRHFPGNYEVIIVDDCSRDRTRELAEAACRRQACLRLLHNEVNRGGGESILRGFSEARGEWVTHNAMDYPFEMEQLGGMMQDREHFDVLVVMRTARSGYTFYRRLVSFVHRTLVRLLFGLDFSDYNFVQVYRREVLMRVRPGRCSTGFLTPELIITAHDLGYRVRAVESRYLPRESGEATSGRPRVILRTIGHMLDFWWRRRRRKRI